MKKRIVIGLVVVALAVSAVVGIGIARDRREHRGPGSGLGLLRSANLTTDQRNQIHGILESHQSQMKAARQQAFEARSAFAKAVLSGNTDVSQAKKKLEDAEANEVEVHAGILAEISKLLTPDQITKLGSAERKPHDSRR